ncbi:MAG TPA: multicopper oxidase domain-containing protein [Candidatus Angelobacter sp.]
MSQVQRQASGLFLLRFAAVLACLAIAFSPAQLAAQCTNTTQADVVALDQVYFWNRLGAVEPQGMVFALARDIVAIDPSIGIAPGNVQLRPDKRPRPLILRVNAGDCLQINFRNLLNSAKPDKEAPSTRTASIHATGMQLVGSIASDGSNVGANTTSLAAPGASATYSFFAEHEGGFLMYSAAATTGGEGDGGSISAGLFGAIMVEPAAAEYYRSQVTADDLFFATTGTTADGHPLINYAAVYPVVDPRTGLPLPAIKAGHPVLKMVENGKIIYSDLNAIITGPNAGRFPAGTYTSTPVNPDRNQPFREFSVIFHDEIGAFQAFQEFRDTLTKKTLQGVRDGFAINYGTGGIGAEILANRFGVGPMWKCTECKYEEFFLTSWAVGDPAMVVDVPANAPDAFGRVIPGPKATKAFYPDDPSNVHHSYIGDHVKFRNIHAGPKEHHIFHLHAHQWVNTPDSDNSTYLDSQAIGPGAAFTYEITYNGSGNRNKTVGDAIFHCHFYPHFAQGMWELWRSHDVFEAGTQLDPSGIPAPGSRAYPDGEILAGTPIPALVPLPNLPMAPMPEAQVQILNGQAVVTGAGNPGYPFFVPAVAGHRPPHPPMDTIDDAGLPRHIITGGAFNEAHTLLDFHKTLTSVTGVAVPEAGTLVEQAAMNYHSVRNHPSFLPNGTPGNFVTNGLPPAPGAPFADPCIDDNGNATGNARTYKAADIQLPDIKFNKAGWHFGQQRMLSLWGDVSTFMDGSKPPEPFFFRANTGDCISYYLTNLVPNEYLQDDFQVRTPTDILGQHIHLVKFDVTSSDGSGNGWNYEDGTFSYQEVLERINAINAAGGMFPYSGTGQIQLTAQPHPYFGIKGAQTSIQRWYADSTLNNAGVDRTLRTVFTHDHFGPSSHQQIGLYAGLVVEPAGATWRNPETGTFMGNRFDGGPTSWHVDVLTANQADSYREFMLEFADFQHAYRPDGTPVNPPDRAEVGLPLITQALSVCNNGTLRPCPEAIAADDIGTMVVNYRNEPLGLRVRNPQTNTQATGAAGDLSNAFLSNITRADAALNVQPAFYPPLTPGVQPGDPFTPLLRAYESDRVQVRVLVGATEEGHNFSVDGSVKWLFEPSDPNSGWRSNQMMGISEHFEFVLPSISAVNGKTPFADIIYKPGTSQDDLWNGLWGLLRIYNGGVGLLSDLKPLPSNPTGNTKLNKINPQAFNGICPNTAFARKISVSAVSASTALPGGTLVYNARPNMNGPLHDPTAILYVRDTDLDKNGALKAGVPIEPLVLRANAGDCLQVTLTNRLPKTQPDLAGFNTLPMIITDFNSNQIVPSSQVGLRSQLLDHLYTDDGQNVGFNPIQTVNPGRSTTYTWYAGKINVNADGSRTAVPIEFGAINLLPSDPIKQAAKGAIGALIIEPQGSTWVEDANQRASATVTNSDGSIFRDFALLFQTGVNLRYGDGTAVPIVALEEDAEDSGHKAFNYRTEPFWKRMNYDPATPLNGGHGGAPFVTTDFDYTNVLSNSLIGSDPVTPVFTAKAGTPVRFRLVMPGGAQRNNVFNLHGHVWQQEPYTGGSTVIGFNPLSEWKGTLFGIGPGSHFDVVPVNGAGGKFKVTGDYLFRTQQSFQFDGGLWGIFRVVP